MKKGALITLVQTVIEKKIVRQNKNDFVIPYKAVEMIINRIIKDVLKKLLKKSIAGKSIKLDRKGHIEDIFISENILKQKAKELYGITL
jgi:hypothetical protein